MNSRIFAQKFATSKFRNPALRIRGRNNTYLDAKYDVENPSECQVLFGYSKVIEGRGFMLRGSFSCKGLYSNEVRSDEIVSGSFQCDLCDGQVECERVRKLQ